MTPKTPDKKATSRRKRRLIYTVGYEGFALDEFLDMLAHERISVVLDVRNRASSHKRGFSKTPLSAAFAQQKIEYVHIPQLGIPRQLRVLYREKKDFGILRRFLKIPFKQHHHLLQEILERFRDRNVCLMCFEKDPSLCHRSIIAEFLSEHDGFEIHHLSSQ